MSEVLSIKTTSTEGSIARTIILLEVRSGYIAIIRRLLVEESEVKGLPNYRVLRKFKNKCLIETWIPLYQETFEKIADFLRYKREEK